MSVSTPFIQRPIATTLLMAAILQFDLTHTVDAGGQSPKNLSNSPASRWTRRAWRR